MILAQEYSDKNVTAWGGMQEMKMLIEKSGISKKIEELGLPEKKSNNSIDGVAIIKSFSESRSHQFFIDLYSWFFEQLQFDNYTLDVDSSVITRYGEQEGSKNGYNPTKRGRNSHHPLFAFVNDTRMVANCLVFNSKK